MRRAGRVDATQEEIVRTLRASGAKVLSLAPMGGNVADLLVYYRSRYFLLEAKSPDGILSDGQRDWLTEWGGYVVRNGTEALRAVGAIR